MPWDILPDFIPEFFRQYIFLFAVFTLLALIARGRDALRWSAKQIASTRVTFCFIAFNALFGSIYFFAVENFTVVFGNLGLPSIHASFWVGIPSVLKIVIVLLVYDFNLYWVHRALHGGGLWPLHAVHHSDTELQFLSWSRSHLLEVIFIACAMLVLGAWLGLKTSDIYMLTFFTGLHQHYVHSNLNWSHGPFRKVFTSPDLHRWHHANVPEAYDKNFASIFPFYDVIFGTYFYPGPSRDVETGFDKNPGEDFVKLLVFPFTEWYRMIADRSDKKNASVGHQNSM